MTVSPMRSSARSNISSVHSGASSGSTEPSIGTEAGGSRVEPGMTIVVEPGMTTVEARALKRRGRRLPSPSFSPASLPAVRRGACRGGA
jgi:hypothetical protein